MTSVELAQKIVNAAEKVPLVYQAGYDKGVLSGDATASYNKGFAEGKQAEHGAFWDGFQLEGKRGEYGQCFRNWQSDMIRPKYNIIFTGGAYQMFFMQSSISKGIEGSFKQILEDCGVKFDTTKCNDFRYVFYYNTLLTELPELVLTTCTDVQRSFYGCTSLHTIEKLVFSSKITNYADLFTNCTSLVNVVVEGEIGVSINVSSAINLSNESAKYFINCLINYKGTDKENTYSIKFAQAVWDRLALEGNTSPNGNTWEEYVADKGWTK